MSLLVLGINHQSATLSTRERVAFAPEKMGDALQKVCGEAGADEVAILSTCNRTEIYVALAEAKPSEDYQQELLRWLADYHGLPAGDLSECHYYHRDEDAVRHMMRVAAGLDSLILGEPQILGQLKSAFAVAEEHRVLSRPTSSKLHRAFQQVFSTAKRIRSETAIGENPVSVAYAAVSLAKRIFSDLSNSKVLLIGAGKTIELVAQHLIENHIQHLIVANRSLDKAQALIEKTAGNIKGEAVVLADIPERLHEADIIISSTASQLPILGKGAVETALSARKHKPMLMIDLAVPRDIEPEVSDLDDVYLYAVDDLKEVIDEGLRYREAAAVDAHKIIDQAVENYACDLRAEGATAIIREYRDNAERACNEEIEKALKGLQRGDKPEELIKTVGRNITNKLLHQPTVQLKKSSSEGRTDMLELAQHLLLNKQD